jgi:hypothetical protein
MFGLKGISTSIKYASKMTTSFKLDSLMAIPKFSYGSSIAEITASQSSIINPNIMRILNLRELILKSKG